MKKLAVYINDKLAGILTEESPGKNYTFAYTPEYVAGGGFPVSVSLPVREEEYKSENLFPFFANMLPEGANRSIICRTKKLDEDYLFELLAAMSEKDIIGAVNIRVLYDD